YILQQMEINSTGYNMYEMVLLEGNLDRGKLENTFRQLIARHETLRTSFHIAEGEPVQKIEKRVQFEIQYQEEAKKDREIEQAARQFIRAFRMSEAPLLRVGIIEIHDGASSSNDAPYHGQNRCILMVDMHHIISDGISMELFIKEFLEIYSGKEPHPLRLQYKDYSQWQNSRRWKDLNKQQETYWLKQFEGEVPVLNLPIDFPRPAVWRFEGKTTQFEITKDETGQLLQMAAEHEATLFMILLAIYNIMLSKLSDQESIVIGTPVMGRPHADLQTIIGIFINTLALKNNPSGEKTVKEFLGEVGNNTLKALENQEYPFENLV
ncbi:MAG: hypothetical protein GY757_33460, partial [bacterium]|nr:hypothetical protein [bacterium]